MTCRICGAETGSRAEVCPSARVDGRLKHSPCARRMLEWHRAIRTVAAMSADSTFRPPSPQPDAEALMRAACAIRHDGDVLADALETVERLAGRVDVARAEERARRLDAASKRIKRRAGVL